MSKESEVKLDELNCLYVLLDRANHDEYLSRIGKEEALEFLNQNQKYAIILRQSLQRLESIGNSKPSEALNCLDTLDDMFYLIKYRTTENGNHEEYEFYPCETKEYNIIKQALLKAQEQEKKKVEYKRVLEIIFKKNVDIKQLKHYIEIHSDDIALKTYNDFHNKDEELTEEEFDFIKRLADTINI